MRAFGLLGLQEELCVTCPALCLLSLLVRRALQNGRSILSPLPVRERMKVRVLVQRAELGCRVPRHCVFASPALLRERSRRKARVRVLSARDSRFCLCSERVRGGYANFLGDELFSLTRPPPLCYRSWMSHSSEPAARAVVRKNRRRHKVRDNDSTSSREFFFTERSYP
jgi:hypothetical protein